MPNNPQKKPRNVIWITTDHMRYDFIRAHGNPDMHTPNLDNLVKNGISFDHCYANSPLCMPSRCSFMTGLYPQQTQVMANGQELRPDFSPTAAECFNHGGYRSVQIGKLHLQCHEDEDLDPKPKDHFGFEVFRLSEEPGCYEDAYRTWLRGERPDLVETFTIPRPMSPARRTESKKFKVLDASWEYSHSGWIAAQASRYLYAWSKRQQPQFMHLGFYAPHPPLNPTRAMFEPYEKANLSVSRAKHDWADANQMDEEALIEYKRHFYAMITGVDLAIGQLVNALKENGEYDDTLIIFGSDHGDACGDHGRVAKGTSYYDGIMRLPLIFHWPNGLENSGRRVEGLVEMVDVLPTMLDLAGVPVPSVMPGNSYAEGMRTGDDITGRSDVYAVEGKGEIMLRSKDFKYLRYTDTEGGREVLYDLRNDPGEFVNVAADEKFQEALRKMRDRAFERTIQASKTPSPKRLRF